MATVIKSKKDAKEFVKNSEKWDAYIIDVHPDNPEDWTEKHDKRYEEIKKIIESK